MSLVLQLRLSGGLLDVARAMRVLKRYSISQSRVWLVREGCAEVATVRGTLSNPRRSKGLTAALARLPGVLEAVISRDDDLLVAHYLASQPQSQLTMTREVQ